MKKYKILILFLFLYNYSYSQVITLERTSCYGSCPVYKLSLFENGNVKYEGLKYVSTKGVIKYSVDSTVVNSLINKFLDIKYFTLKDSYTEKIIRTWKDKDGKEYKEVSIVTDLPTTITSFNYKGKFHKVINYYGGPNSLSELEDLIDTLLNSSKYIN